MKKSLIIVLCLALVLSLTACGKTVRGTDGLIEKARKELPITDADTIDIQYAGMCGVDNKAIVWFISGNEYQTHYYLPMEIERKGNGADYTFVHTYKPVMDRCSDVAIVNWNGGYAFLINNPKVAMVRMALENGEVVEEVVQKGTIPHAFYVPSIPTEYAFLNAEDGEIQ